MKILLAVHHFLPRYTAGAELYTFRLARWLIANGHTAEVVCVEELDAARPASLTARREDYGGVPVYRLSLGMAGAPYSWGYDHPLINAWLQSHLVQSRPDLVHLHGGYLLGAGVIDEAHRAGIPAVVTLHDYWFLCPRFTLLRGDGSTCAKVPDDPAACGWCLKLSQRRYRIPERLSRGAVGQSWITLVGGSGREAQAERRERLRQSLGLADLVFAPSRFLAAHFAQSVGEDRLRVQRLGIGPAQPRELAPPGANAALRLGYIGQIAPHKGVDLLVRALALLPQEGRPVRLAIHGDLAHNPRYTRSLRHLAAADRRVTLAGRFENSAVDSVLETLDALVVPSIWYENSPLAILEAQSAGRPVLASAMGGMAELVRHEVDGLHFRPGDAADLARQIQRLREDPQLLTRLAAGIRPPPSVDDEMRALLAAYQQLSDRRTAVVHVEVA